MIGARQSAGSTISNGGDNSPSNWVIAGAIPEIRISPSLIDKATDSAGKRKFYVGALSVIAIILPSEKSRKAVGTGLKRAKNVRRH
jgi:hypothetical protein